MSGICIQAVDRCLFNFKVSRSCSLTCVLRSLAAAATIEEQKLYHLKLFDISGCLGLKFNIFLIVLISELPLLLNDKFHQLDSRVLICSHLRLTKCILYMKFK